MNRQANLLFIFATLAIDAIGLGIQPQTPHRPFRAQSAQDPGKRDAAIYLPGSPYLLASVFFLVAWWLALRWNSRTAISRA